MLAIGNRLANMNAYRKNDLDQLNTSHDALETLLQPANNNNNSNNNNANLNSSIKKTPLSNNSLHVDSAVSMSGVSQQSIMPPAPSSPKPPPKPQTPPVIQRDDAQMVDFLSCFLFPITFIIFNIIYWMVYLNMQVLSTN